jgi:hypothetical protein
MVGSVGGESSKAPPPFLLAPTALFNIRHNRKPLRSLSGVLPIQVLIRATNVLRTKPSLLHFNFSGILFNFLELAFAPVYQYWRQFSAQCR